MIIVTNIHQKQELLRNNYKISIIVKHYSSGKFSFDVLNFDGVQWCKKTGFLENSFYSYNEALQGGIDWVKNNKVFSQLLETVDFIEIFN